MKQISFRLKPGKDLKAEIKKAVKENNVKAGVVFSVVAGLENAVLRMAGSTPENQKIKKWEGPLEVVSGTGTLSQDGCHIHVSLSDEDGNVIGGHLKEGCIVKSTAEIVLGVFQDIEYRRVMDKETGFKELEV